MRHTLVTSRSALEEMRLADEMEDWRMETVNPEYRHSWQPSIENVYQNLPAAFAQRWIVSSGTTGTTCS